MSSILTRLLEKGLPTRDVQIATTGEQQQRPLKFEGAQEGNFYNGDLLVVGGLDNGGLARHLNLDTQGRLYTNGATPEGTVITSSTNPVLISGRYDATPRTLTDGQHGALAVNNEGKLMIDLQNASLTATVNVDIDQSTDSVQLYANDGTANRAVRSDASGRLVHVGAVASGDAAAGNPVLTAGVDGTGLARTLATNTLGMVNVCSQFKAGDAQSGDTYPILIGGMDENGNTQQVAMTQNGNVTVAGGAAEGDYSWPQPVLIGASDGTYMTKLKSDTTGRIITVGAGVSGAAVAGNPVLHAGSDGTNTRTLRTDTSGRQVVVGAASNGAVAVGNPVLMAGVDGSNNVSTLSIDATGSLGVKTAQTENAANNDSLFAIAGRYDTTPRTITSGNMGAIAVSSEGHLLVDIAPTSGSTTQIYGTDGTTNRAVLTSTTGNLLVGGIAAAGAAITGNPLLNAGSDGTNIRTLSTDASGRQVMVGAGATGAALTGNPVLMAGSDGTNARNLTTDTSGRQVMVGAAASGATLAGNPVLMAGSDGTNACNLSTDASGRQVMVGAGATGAALVGNPVLIAGSDGTNARNLNTDASGRQVMVGAGATGAALTGNPVLIAGSDGTNARNLTTDASGRQVMVGAGAAGAALTGNPVLMAGSDGTNARHFSTDTSGRQVMVGAVAEMAPVAGNPVLLGAATNTGAAAYVRSNNAGYLLSIVHGQDDVGSDLALRQDSNRNVLIGGALAATSDINDVAVNPVLTGGLDGAGLVRYALVDASGAGVVVGPAIDGDPITTAPVLMAGRDNSANTRTLATDGVGVLKVRLDTALHVALHATNPATAQSQVLLSPGSDVFGSAAAFTPLLAAQFFNVVSSTANNSFALNTGCTRIVLSGIDENNALVTETVQIDGVTPVSTANKFFAFYKAYAFDKLDGTSYISVRPAAGGSTNADYVYVSNETTYIPILYCPEGYTMHINAASIHTNSLATFSLKGYNRTVMDGPTQQLSGVKTYWRNAYIQAFNVDLGTRGMVTLDAGDYVFVVNESSSNNTSVGDTLTTLYAEYRLIL
jgi:hypothetical protein